jgi:hypothetical protein
LTPQCKRPSLPACIVVFYQSNRSQNETILRIDRMSDSGPNCEKLKPSIILPSLPYRQRTLPDCLRRFTTRPFRLQHRGRSANLRAIACSRGIRGWKAAMS